MANLRPKRKVAVWYWPGTNCEVESMEAWKYLGADAQLFFAAKSENWRREKIQEFHLHHLAGGFTYGDDSGAGAVSATMSSEILLMLAELGVPVILICNGFQIGVRAQMFGPGFALVENACGEFQSMPVQHRVLRSNCVWTKGLEDRVLTFPSAHRFGQFVITGHRAPRINLAYESQSPNGGDIAGICSDNGLIFGLMDHPERPFGNPDGLEIFRRGLAAA